MKKPTASSPDFFSTQVSSARRFYLNLQPPRNTRLAVVCGGVEHCAPEYEIQRDTFPFYSLEYVARGEGRLKLGRRNHELKPGAIFAYGPGIRQHITASPQKPLVKYFVDFAGNQSNQWLRHCRLPPGKMTQVFPPGELQPLFDELIRSGQRGTRHTPELCRQLLDCIGLTLLESCAPLKGTESPAFATYQACRQLIHEHFRRLRTLEQAAKECHVNTAYLCRLFRRYDHQSPYLLLTRLKMNVAAEQLRERGALVKNVAADLGFANPFHFSRVFKSVFAVSPEAFRRLR
jgi:AraC-like DNA-binding protein